MGRLAGQQLVEQGAERVDVGAGVDVLAPRLLRRHVRGRAHDVSDRGRGRAGPGVGLLDLVVADLALAAAGQVLGQAPVDDHGLAEVADHHVGRLDVAVDDALAVRVGDRLGHREHVRQEGHALVEAALLLDELLERPPRDQLHRVVRIARRPAAGLVHRDDARVLQPGGDERLAHEPGLGRRRALQELLDGDRPAKQAVMGPDHAAEAASRVHSLQLVARAVLDRQRGGSAGGGARCRRRQRRGAGRGQRLARERVGIGGLRVGWSEAAASALVGRHAGGVAERQPDVVATAAAARSAIRTGCRTAFGVGFAEWSSPAIQRCAPRPAGGPQPCGVFFSRIAPPVPSGDTPRAHRALRVWRAVGRRGAHREPEKHLPFQRSPCPSSRFPAADPLSQVSQVTGV